VAKELIVQLRDDMDGTLSEDVATRGFSFDGVDYEIELNDNNHENFRLDILKWIQAARKVSKPARKRAHKPQAATAAEVRAWAVAKGYDVPQRGAVSNELRKAHAKAMMRAKAKKGS
jgi:hypothetical protein